MKMPSNFVEIAEFKYVLKSSDHQYVRANEYIVLITQSNMLNMENFDPS